MDANVESPDRCLICRNLEIAVPLEHGYSLSSITKQSSKGCKTCMLVGDAVVAIAGKDAQLDDIKVGWDTMRLQGLRIVVGSLSLEKFLYGIDMYTAEGNETPWHQTMYTERPTDISGCNGSEAALSSVKHWIRNCDQHHSCRPMQDTLLPTRLLNVQNPRRISLYCPREGESGVYACLSHCWGDSPTLRTMSSNIFAHRDFIAWHKLPKTFQDAITVVHRLGISYLWIDSLCIIQDVEQDWQTESAKMADIYAQSALTVAASLAARDSDSLFIESPNCHRSIPLRNESGIEIFVRKTLGHGHGPIPLPLMRRAWVLQERLLSPRVVHFTHEELVWECMEKTTCECGCIRSLWSPGHVPFDKALLYSPNLGRGSRQEIKDRWRRLAEEYSRLQLTLARDKLPAISGAARRFSEFIPGDYLAGLWKHGLVADLLWERRGLTSRQPDLECIPSWSWLSIGIEVAYDECMVTDDLAVIVSASCSPLRQDDAFGEIRGGEIHLVATLLPLVLFPTVQHTQPTQIDDIGSDVVVQIIFDDTNTNPSPAMVCARMALRRRVYTHGFDEEIWLVLVPALGDCASYNRIGILKVCHEDTSSLLNCNQYKEPETIVLV